MFQRKSEFKYVTKNTPPEELLAECRRLKNLVCQLRFRKNTQKKRKGEVRQQWKHKYLKLQWKLFKESQRVYGKQMQIDKMKTKSMVQLQKGRKYGYRAALRKINKTNYKVKHLARFLFHTDTVMRIYNIDFREYAFIMWAGRYDFFDKRDFDITCGDVEIEFYRTVNRMMKRGLVSYIMNKPGSARRIFALTGTGIEMYNKISKFTNKFLKGDTGTSGIRDNIQNA